MPCSIEALYGTDDTVAKVLDLRLTTSLTANTYSNYEDKIRLFIAEFCIDGEGVSLLLNSGVPLVDEILYWSGWARDSVVINDHIDPTTLPTRTAALLFGWPSPTVAPSQPFPRARLRPRVVSKERKSPFLLSWTHSTPSSSTSTSPTSVRLWSALDGVDGGRAPPSCRPLSGAGLPTKFWSISPLEPSAAWSFSATPTHWLRDACLAAGAQPPPSVTWASHRITRSDWLRGLRQAEPPQDSRMQPQAPQPSLLRAVVAQDGRIKANFSDNTVLLLDATGRTFTFVEPSGKQHRQLSEYAVSAHEVKLAVVLEFRNSHVDAPFFCRALRRLPKQSFETGFPIRYAAWPACPLLALRAGLLETRPDGSCELRSEDDTARMVVAPHAKRFAVTFPLQVAVEEAPRRHHFVWQTQMFWAGTARLSTATDGAIEPSSSSTSQASVRTPLPTHAADGKAQWTAFPRDSWWCECTSMLFPTDVALAAEWRPEAMYHLASDGSEEVLVVVHADRSTLCSFQAGKFFRHHRTPVSLGESVYATSNPPRQCRGVDGKSHYDLAPIVSHAATFREAAVRLISLHGGDSENVLRAPSLAPPAPRLSTSVKEVHEQPGTARFTSYADGRVRAVFVDRTILEMEPEHRQASLTLPDGERLTVNTANPVGVEAYVSAAQRFARWTFSTVEQRVAADQMSRALKVEMENNSRMQQVLSWTIDGRIPELDSASVMPIQVSASATIAAKRRPGGSSLG
eukprot:jgi/Tetstr1/422403/TSEL_013241.t1